MNKKDILGEYPTFFKPSVRNYTSTETTCIETTLYWNYKSYDVLVSLSHILVSQNLHVKMLEDSIKRYSVDKFL